MTLQPYKHIVVVVIFFLLHTAESQVLRENGYKFNNSAIVLDSKQLSNSVTDIFFVGDTMWIGTGKGLSRSVDGGRTWKNYYGTPEFGKEDVSAIAVFKNQIWVATAHSVVIDDKSLPEGSGIRYSSDGGTTWQVFPQPVDVNNVDTLVWNSKSTVDSYNWNPKSVIRALGITTTIQNLTYDISANDSAVWIASWAGMVRKSTDKGKTWNRVILPPDSRSSISPNDSLVFDLSPSQGKLGLERNLNHSGFSVLAEDNNTIWVGTAGGINKTTDGGKSWLKFSHQNQIEPISGNFVVALAKQKFGTKNILWAATINAEGNDEKRGVSFSDDGGVSWKTTLLGEFTHNFGIKNDIVYAVTDNGIFRSTDFGNSWSTTGTIQDPSNKQRIASTKFYSSAPQGDTVFFGGNDGLIKTIDNSSVPFGSAWKILRASQSVSGTHSTYAFPNPFSPDDEVVRLHYAVSKITSRVTIRIFDFGMNLVRTVIQNVTRNGNAEYDEIWNGKTDAQQQVVNGVYFYEIIIDDEQPMWGKILVLQ